MHVPKTATGEATECNRHYPVAVKNGFSKGPASEDAVSEEVNVSQWDGEWDGCCRHGQVSKVSFTVLGTGCWGHERANKERSSV